MMPTLQLGQTGLYRRTPAGGAPATYLDELAVLPRAVLSLRKLISTATTAIRVRRSSDSTEQDIGFTGNALDTAALNTFVGAGSGFITKFYDQTGNLEHLEQATAAKQPRIVNAGVYDGKAVFDGTDDGMAITLLTLGTAYVGIYRKLALPGTYSGNPMQYELSPEFNTTGGGTLTSFYAAEGGKLWSVQSKAGPSARRHVYSPSWASLVQNTVLYDTSIVGGQELRLWTSGVEETAHVGAGNEQTGNYRSDQNLFVGSRNNASLYCRMDLETFVVYNADTSGIRSSIEALV